MTAPTDADTVAVLQRTLTQLRYQPIESKDWHTIWARPPLVQHQQCLPRIWLPHPGAPDFTPLALRAAAITAGALDQARPINTISHALAHLALHHSYRHPDPLTRIHATHQLQTSLAAHQHHLITAAITAGADWDDLGHAINDTGLGVFLDHPQPTPGQVQP